MEEWKEYKLAEVCENIYSGGTPSSMKASYWNGNLPWLSSGETNQRYIYDTEKCITQEGADNSSTRYAYRGSTVIASAGQGHTRGQASMLCIDTYVNQSVLVLKPNPLFINPHFLYYNLDSRYNELRQLSDGTSTRGSLSGKILKDLKIYLPSLDEQQKIASILKSLDDKIEVNRKINENLEQQAQALFKSWFVDFEPFKNGEFVESELGMIPKGWRVYRADEVFDINIGKTPPRKEPEWFTKNTSDNIWVSIADMGSCGMFVSESSEYLTNEAINRFNILMVDEGSVLLSFKLTVGRVAIADTRLTTNEAIARFQLPRSYYREFLYLYLKQYKYGNLGSTSSIATAVNSKTIKGMKLITPPEEVISCFSKHTKPLFDKIKVLSQESRRLAELRDTLLPKLMSGELEVKDIEQSL